MVDAEHHPRAAESGDHLVADQKRSQLPREPLQLLQVSARRNDIARRALDGLDEDRGDVPRRLDVDLLPEKLDAVPAARWKCLVEGASGAGSIGA